MNSAAERVHRRTVFARDVMDKSRVGFSAGSYSHAPRLRDLAACSRRYRGWRRRTATSGRDEGNNRKENTVRHRRLRAAPHVSPKRGPPVQFRPGAPFLERGPCPRRSRDILMKRTERHHLKDNELAHFATAARASVEARKSQVTSVVIAVVVILATAIGYTAWRGRVQGRAGTLLAEAMAVQDARVGAPEAPGSPSAGPSYADGERKEPGRADQAEDGGRPVSVDRGRPLRPLSRGRGPDGARQRQGSRDRLSAGDRRRRRQHLRPDGAAWPGGSAGPIGRVRQGDRNLQGSGAT